MSGNAATPVDTHRDAELDVVAAATQLAYETLTVGDSAPEMPGYVVEQIFDDQWANTGFYAVAFRHAVAGRCIIAARGSQDRLDVIADADLGINQYQRNRDQLLDYVGANLLGNAVTLAGHSLGGCLSQYLAYDAANAFPLGRERLTVHTHNGLGGLLGIVRLHGAYDEAVLAGVTCRNYRHPHDPVSRLGGQVGGQVQVLPTPPVATGNLHFVHSNRRFLPSDGVSVLPLATAGPDEAYALARTLKGLTPGITKALHEIFEDHTLLGGIADLYRMIRLVPTAERGEVMRLAAELLPFHGHRPRNVS